MDVAPRVSVIIVSFNTREALRHCLQSLRDQQGLNLEILVVDNASADGSAAMVAEAFPQVRLLAQDQNLGFAAANNRAFAVARGDYLVLLNSDAQLQSGVLQTAVALMDAHPDVGLCGARLSSPEGHWQPSARCFPSPLNDFLALSGLAHRFPRNRFFGRMDRTWADPGEPAAVDWVPGAFAVLRREALDRVGGFDERFFLYYEEVDLCRRLAAAGYVVQYWPQLRVVHIGGESARAVTRLHRASAGSQLTLWRMRSAYLYYRKHHGGGIAWLARFLEASWHRLRYWRNRQRRSDEAAAKADESRLIVELARQAWQDTAGGRQSPPRPW